MKRNLLRCFGRIHNVRPFDGDGGAGGDGAGGTSGAGSSGSGAGGAGGTAAGSGGAGGAAGKTFSQDDVNRMMAEERRKHEDKTKTAITQLEEMKKAAGLSDKARTTLETQIEEYKNSLLTKEEQTKKELEKKDKEFKTALETTSKERDFWNTQYANETAKNQILQSAGVHGAISAEQLTELVMPKTRLVEILDAEGKATGKFQPRVKFPTTNDKKEAIELDLTVEETIKRMKDEPERFGNLFKSTIQGGLGAGGSSGGGSLNGTQPPSDPAQYRLWRAQQKKAGTL